MRIRLTAVLFLYFVYLALLSKTALAEREPPSFVVGAMRVEPKPWDKSHNFALLERYAKDAAPNGAKLVVTCEDFLNGYTSNPKFAPGLTREKFIETCEPLDGPWLKRVRDLARELKLFVSIGFAERDGKVMHNSVAVISPVGKIVLLYRKTHLIDEPFNTPGDEFPVSKTELGTLGRSSAATAGFPKSRGFWL